MEIYFLRGVIDKKTFPLGAKIISEIGSDT